MKGSNLMNLTEINEKIYNEEAYPVYDVSVEYYTIDNKHEEEVYHFGGCSMNQALKDGIKKAIANGAFGWVNYKIAVSAYDYINDKILGTVENVKTDIHMIF